MGNDANNELELFAGILVEASAVDGKIDKKETSSIKISLIDIFEVFWFKGDCSIIEDKVKLFPENNLISYILYPL